MDWMYMVLTCFLQGVTEFLPVSSSAHLLVLPHIAKMPDQGVIMDIGAHIGSLAAAAWFYRASLLPMLSEFVRLDLKSGSGRLALKLIIATIPAAVAGLLLALSGKMGRDPRVAIYTSIAFGLVLFLVDRLSSKRKEIGQLTFTDALMVGMMQALALVPGVSRSGISITGAMMLGQKRESAVNFAFLMSVPVIFLAGSYAVVTSAAAGSVDWGYFLATAGLSFLFSLAAIRFMLAWTRKFSLAVFAAYRILFGIFLYFYL
jgi:undecaprenyl-diphosphatase